MHFLKTIDAQATAPPDNCPHCGTEKTRENGEAITYACGLSYWKAFGVTQTFSPLAQRFETRPYLP